jgi:hypothetical protein
MVDLRDAIRSAIDTAAETAEYNRRKEENLAQAKSLRFAWAEGRDTLGIDAPKDIAVHREEIYEKIQREHLSGHREPM